MMHIALLGVKFEVIYSVIILYHPGLLETFQNNNALLDQIQKCLEAYLESKRVIFPRYPQFSNMSCMKVLYTQFLEYLVFLL